MINDWELEIQKTIEEFPEPHRQEVLDLWIEWLKTDPEAPLYENWERYSSKIDDEEALFTQRRVYLKRVRNDLRDMEIPLKGWQKAAKVLAAVASVFLVLFLALSRVFRATE